jgi:hypothetical protein
MDQAWSHPPLVIPFIRYNNLALPIFNYNNLALRIASLSLHPIWRSLPLMSTGLKVATPTPGVTVHPRPQTNLRSKGRIRGR